MRILQLTPGTGSFYCGSCLRDVALVRALRGRGHEATISPLYLPFALETEEDPSATEPVRMGGINVYLQQKAPLMGRLPAWLTRWLDRPGLLRWASRRGSMTEPADLGEITVSILRGEEGRQRAEIQRLVKELGHEERPEVVVLSNVMLAGLVRPLAQELGVPVVVSLQGEQPFLDELPEPHRSHAWAELRERCREVDAFLAVSDFTARLMASRLELDPARVHVVHNGIELDDFRLTAPRGDRPPTIGYLARMCADKGLPVLVEAYLELKRRSNLAGLRLDVCGVMLSEDRPLVDGLRARIDAEGHGGDVVFRPNVEREEKLHFLAGLDVLSVPATYGESFGLYVLEALASGIPVVQPESGAFPELLEATGGGRLCSPDDPMSLADGLEELLMNPEGARGLGARGREAVLAEFSADRMAERVEAILQSLGGAQVP